MNQSIKGTIYVLLSAICFALGGVLIKLVPWSALSIQGARSAFSSLVVIGYMVLTKRKFVFNKSVLLGGISIFSMALTFVLATKLTTAANAIVLQFTEPIFVILLMWIIYKKKPGKDAVFASIVIFTGILCFFFESLSAGGMLGNAIAIVSGFAYAWVFMIKKFPGADFESSLLLSNALSVLLGIPFYVKETQSSAGIWFYIVLLGVFQCGLSYVFLSKGLDYVSPVMASLTSTIEPILNPLLVAWFYDEKVGMLAAVGALLVVGSATIYSILQAKNPTIHFRRMEVGDVEQIAAIEDVAFTDAWTSQNIYETFCQKQAFVTVAEVGSEVVGYCIVYHVMEEAEIARIAVADKYRRRGIGRGLLDYTCVCCKEKQVERLLLDVREGNTGARTFYQSYGFAEDGNRKDFYNSPKENAVLMSKGLL